MNIQKENKMAEKKNFKNVENPAFAFLGDAVNKEVDNNDTEKYRMKIQELEKQLQEKEYKEKETKSKKINLLLYPSVLNDFDRIAKKKNVSRNELANLVFREYVKSVEGQNKIHFFDLRKSVVFL